MILANICVQMGKGKDGWMDESAGEQYEMDKQGRCNEEAMKAMCVTVVQPDGEAE